MATSIKETGVVLPHADRAGRQAARRTPSFSKRRREGRRARRAGLDPARCRAASEYAFRVTDGAHDVPGRLSRHRARHVHRQRGRRRRAAAWATDGTFHATELLAKCASRYENAPDAEKYKQTPGYKAASRPRVILIGELSLWVALLMAAWSTTVSFAGGATAPRRSDRQRRARTLRDVRDGRARVDRSVDRAADARLLARVRRVVTSSANMPSVYMFTAFWSGQAGSMLFWALILSVLLDDRDRDDRAREIAELMPWATRHALGDPPLLHRDDVLQGESVRRASTSCRSTAAG